MSMSRLDVRVLKERFFDKPKLLQTMYREFSRQVKEIIPEMQEVMSAGHLERLEALAHIFKGNAALIGAYRVQDLAYTIEKASSQGDHNVLEIAMQDLFSEVETVLSEFQSFLANFDS